MFVSSKDKQHVMNIAQFTHHHLISLRNNQYLNIFTGDQGSDIMWELKGVKLDNFLVVMILRKMYKITAYVRTKVRIWQPGQQSQKMNKNDKNRRFSTFFVVYSKFYTWFIAPMGHSTDRIICHFWVFWVFMTPPRPYLYTAIGTGSPSYLPRVSCPKNRRHGFYSPSWNGPNVSSHMMW